jgi:hypothetical protein
MLCSLEQGTDISEESVTSVKGPLKCWYLSTRLHGVISQKTVIFTAIISIEWALTLYDAIMKTTDSTLWCRTVDRCCVTEFCLFFQLPKYTRHFFCDKKADINLWWIGSWKYKCKDTNKLLTQRTNCNEVFACSQPSQWNTFPVFQKQLQLPSSGRDMGS